MGIFSKFSKKANNDGEAVEGKKGGFAFEVLKASVFALLFALVLSLIVALIMTFVEFSELASDIVNQAIRAVAMVLACILAFKSPVHGWLKGLISGLVFAVLSFIVFSLIGDGFVFDLRLLIDTATSVVMGIIAGVIAVNIKSKRQI